MIFTDAFYGSKQVFFSGNEKTRLNASLKDGAFGTVEKGSFFRSVKKFFTFTQDENLLAVSEKMQNIFTQIEEKKGTEYDRLKRELRSRGFEAYNHLKVHLNSLNVIFAKGNDTNIISLVILKIINLVRIIFFQERIVLKKYCDLSETRMNALEELSRESFKLDEQEKKEAESIFKMVSSHEVEKFFSGQELVKLKKGYIFEINFDVGRCAYKLKYDKEGKHFILKLVHTTKVPDQDDKYKEMKTGAPDEVGFDEVTIETKKENENKKHNLKVEWMFSKKWEGFFSTEKWKYAITESSNLKLESGWEISIPDEAGKEPVRFVIDPPAPAPQPTPQPAAPAVTPEPPKKRGWWW